MSEACLDRSYSRFNKIKNGSDKALSGTCLDSLYFGADLSGNRPSQLRRLGGSSLHFALLRSGTAAQAVQHGPGLSAFFQVSLPPIKKEGLSQKYSPYCHSTLYTAQMLKKQHDRTNLTALPFFKLFQKSAFLCI